MAKPLATSRMILASLMVPSVISIVACGTPASQPSATTSAVTPAPAAAPISAPIAAPGRDRYEADPHPEQATPDAITLEALAQGITTYVESESARNNGAFTISEPGSQPLSLTLSTVHREKLSRLADGRFFACADFKSKDGSTYDIDVFMRSQSNGLTPTDVIVHKKDGQARFNWIEQNGVWVQAPVSSK